MQGKKDNRTTWDLDIGIISNMDFKVIIIYVNKKLNAMIENTVEKKPRKSQMKNLRMKIQ